jgi:hypothetical protein
MKRNYTLLFFLLATVSILAQTPEKMSYQVVLRDASNTLLTNQQVGIQISILQTTITGSAVYIETQTATTNINGLVSLEIGSGTSSDDFSAIDWSAGPFFIKTATDASGGSNYSIIGTSQLMSVPFALYAKTSGSSTPGPQGAPGIQGETGTVGTNGTNGTKGDTGEKGDIGDQGAQGIQGETGATGLTTAVNAIAQIDGNITLTTTDIPEGDNKYYTDALVSANTAVVANSTNTAILNALIAALEARIVALEPQPASIGDLRAGGVVFWVDPADNTHGLVCAFADYADYAEWGCYGTDLPNVPNATYGIPYGPGAEIGDGMSNTNEILIDCPTAPAALAARSLGPEWFLPSVNELKEMYLNKALLVAVDGFSPFSSYYWSSTEKGSNQAWVQIFSGGQGSGSKTDTYNVRAVRAF